jgi:hypothetical protein
MAKKDKETKVEVEQVVGVIETHGPVVQTTTVPEYCSEGVRIAQPGEVCDHDVLLVAPCTSCDETVAKLAELEAKLAAGSVTSLTDEQKEALNHCFKWLQHFVKRSNAVEFRRDTKHAMTVLSKLL